MLWSNRSAAKAGKKQYEAALEDAEQVCGGATFSVVARTDNRLVQCIKVNPSWAKGYARKGAALHGLKRFDPAIEAYESGLKLEDSAPLRKGLEEVKAAQGMIACQFACILLCTERICSY